MANILLTNKCVRQCPYCFAGEEMAQTPATEFIAWENIVYLADLLIASDERRVSLLGGEPTLHPEFTDILLYLVARGFHVTAFTSGLMPAARLEALKAHVAGPVTFVCNLNNPAQTQTADSETAKLHEFLAALGPQTMPGFNIYRSDFDLGFLFDLVARYGMKKRLRLGIAHPIPGAANLSIPVDEIGPVIARLYAYKERFETLRLKPSFDCGFPLCRISDEQLGWMTRLTGKIEFKCNPAIDITPDMQVYSCFPLSGMNRKSVFDFDSFKQIDSYYRALHKAIRAEVSGIYDDCARCPHPGEGTCAGGGICQLVNRLAKENPEKLRQIERAHGQTCLPA